MSAKQRWTALIVLSVSLFVVMMDMTILMMALPNLVKDLNATSAEQLWIVDIYSLVLAGLIITMSALADRWGRKRTLLTGFFIFGIVSLLVVFADSPLTVIALRALLGAAAAMIMPTTLSMIRTIFLDPKERTTALAIWAAVSAVGGILGPIIGGALLEYFPWQATFLVNVPFAALAVAAGLFLLPEFKEAHPPRLDKLATLLSLSGMVSLVWSIKHFAKEGLTDGVSWLSLTVGLILLLWFVIRCLKSTEPLLDVRLFKNRAFTAGTIAALMSMFGMAAIILLITQWLQVVEGLSPLIAGIYILPMAAGSLIISIIAPGLAVRIGARMVIAGGLAIAGSGFLCMYFLGEPVTYIKLVPTLIMLGAGIGSLAIASAVIMSSTSQAKAGNAAAIEETMYDFGNVLGIAVLGSISALFYRSYLEIERFTGQSVTESLASYANESVIGAIEVSAQTGIIELAAKAQTAYSESLVATGIIGGIILISSAIMVFLLIPKSFDLSKENHH
ncbi:MFS transporter [Bacillus mesophilum]|uniref:MFS transporter n=2 Tax=Bacillus mesophilum TaxID=1071718 RepID=A0A7V7USS1_9BACI|nr:MFS transporter [Bacillus mesophilum]